MFKMIKALFNPASWNFLRDRHTDWAHLEISRLTWFIGFVSVIVFTSIYLYTKGQFDIMNYCQALGIYNGGSGAAAAMKQISSNRAAPPARSAE